MRLTRCKLYTKIPVTISSKLCLLNYLATKLQIYRFVKYHHLHHSHQHAQLPFNVQNAFSFWISDLHVLSSSRDRGQLGENTLSPPKILITSIFLQIKLIMYGYGLFLFVLINLILSIF
jgi:hypothetical protein